MRLRFLIPLLMFLLVSWFLFKGLYLDPKAVPSPLIGKDAPAFDQPTLDGPSARLSRQQMLGKVWILNVFASWCSACREEHAALLSMSRTSGIRLIGLDYKDTREDARQWLNQAGNPYSSVIFDPDGRLGIDFGVYGVPETFVIDANGVVRYKQTGVLTQDILEQQIYPLVRSLS